MTREWYFQVMGQDVGPLTAAELKGKVSMGQIQPDTLVRKGSDGKWIFATNVKGLIPPPPPPPPPPELPPSPVVPMPEANETSATKLDVPAARLAGVPTSIRMADDSSADSTSSPHEFYDFVGFRDAISPVLYDAAKQFVTDCGITLSQLNRRAIADFIQRPELGSDLTITSVEALTEPTPDNSQGPGPGSCSAEASDDSSLFRFSLLNHGQRSIQIHHGVFLPTRVVKTADVAKPPRISDPPYAISVRLGNVAVGKAVRIALDTSIPPQGSRDITIWFHDASPKSLGVRGQLLLSYGSELALSKPFSMTLHE
jgi:hypothetical protein